MCTLIVFIFITKNNLWFDGEAMGCLLFAIIADIIILILAGSVFSMVKMEIENVSMLKYVI